jgi:hypothetical protein
MQVVLSLLQPTDNMNWERWQALVNAIMNIKVPQNAGNVLTSLEPVSFSRRTLLHG